MFTVTSITITTFITFITITIIITVTPGLHNKIPAHKIFARVWVAQKPFLS